MKKMRLVIAILMAAALVFAFTACSGTDSGKTDSDSSQTDVNSKPSSEKDAKGSDTGSHGILPEFDKTGTIEETLLTETYGVSITATGLTYTNSAVKLSLKLENKSDSKREAYAGTAGYGCNSVNGYMIHDGYMRCELDPGATEEEEVSFSYAELYCHGISKIADIGIGFDVEDDEYHHEYSEMIFIKTQNADGYDYSEDTYLKTMKGNVLQNAYGITVDAIAENTVYSEGGISLISQAIVTNKDGDSRLMLEFESKADQALNVRLSGLKLNGEEVSTSYLASDLIWQGKKDVLTVSLGDYFENNDALDASSLRTAEFNINLTNTDGTSVTQKTAVTIEF